MVSIITSELSDNQRMSLYSSILCNSRTRKVACDAPLQLGIMFVVVGKEYSSSTRRQLEVQMQAVFLAVVDSPV